MILTAGSLHSPQILELSGIGSSARLCKHGIPTLVDLPGVGKNLQDHCIISISYKVDDSQVSGDIIRDQRVFQSFIRIYEETKGGPLSGTSISAAYLPPVDDKDSVPIEKLQQLIDQHLDRKFDIGQELTPGRQEQLKLLQQIVLSGRHSTAEYLYLPIQLHTDHSTIAGLFDKSTERNYISIVAILCRPFSRSSVHIRSKNIQDKPTLNPNYLSHPLDIEILARYTQFIE